MGKSSLAEALVRHQPLALVVDIDRLRTRLGRWEERPESRLVARDLAIALAAAHLGAGHDVVVPQFLGRLDFIERLEQTASSTSTSFVEVMLVVDPALAVERFRARRARSADRSHPEADVDDRDVESMIAAAADALGGVAARRPTIHRVDASGDVDDTCASLLTVLDGRPR